MIRLVLFFICLSCFDVRSERISVTESDLSKFGCTFINDDYYKRTVGDERVIWDKSLIDDFEVRQEEMYSFLEENVNKSYFFRKRFQHSPEHYFDRISYQYDGARVTVYRPGNGLNERMLGFCFEGLYTNKLVNKFFPKKRLDSLKLEGDGEFYIAAIETESTIKIVKKNNLIVELYFYSAYD